MFYVNSQLTMFKHEYLSRSNVIYILDIFLPGHVTVKAEPVFSNALSPKRFRSPFA
jgi:hypothetical protein